MEKISSLIPGAVQNDSLTNSTKLRGETSSKKGLPISWASAIFKKFQAWYGHKWVSAMDGIEEFALMEWAGGLSGLTGEEIKRGFDTWEEDWPPSLSEFRNACLGKLSKVNEFGLNYIPEYYRPQPITERSKLLSSDEREERREEARQNIGELKSILGIRSAGFDE